MTAARHYRGCLARTLLARTAAPSAPRTIGSTRPWRRSLSGWAWGWWRPTTSTTPPGTAPPAGRAGLHPPPDAAGPGRLPAPPQLRVLSQVRGGNAPLFARYPEALANTRRVAERCHFELRYGLQDLPGFPFQPEWMPRPICASCVRRRCPASYPSGSEAVRRNWPTSWRSSRRPGWPTTS